MEVKVGVVEPGVVAAPSVSSHAEAWLETQVEPSQPVFWRYRGRGGVPVAEVSRLVGFLSALGPGDWGVLERAGGRRWAQTMRVHDGWIVEVDGADCAEPMARRVHEIGARGAEEDRLINLADDGRLTATYLDGEAIAEASVAAWVMWAWMRGRVPDGYELREVQQGVD